MFFVPSGLIILKGGAVVQFRNISVREWTLKNHFF